MFDFKYSGKSHPYFTSLNAESLQFLRTCGAAIAQLPKQFSSRQDRKHVLQWRKLLHATSSTPLAELRQNTYRLSRQVAADKRYRAWCVHQQSLQCEETWHTLRRKVTKEQQAEVTHLQRQLKPYLPYLHFSSEALYQMITHTLPALTAYYDVLQQEWQAYGKRLDASTQRDITQFKENLAEWIQQTRTALAHAMLAKLTAASKANDLAYDDPLYDTMVHLKQLGALKPGMRLWQPSRTLTLTHIDAFQQFITEYGDRRFHLRAKHRIGWLTAHPQYRTVMAEKQLYCMPQRLHDLVPHGMFGRLWLWLVDGVDVAHYCRAHQPLIATVRTLENRGSVVLNPQELGQHATALHHATSGVVKQLQDLSMEQPQGRWALWYRTRSQHYHVMMNYWRGELTAITAQSLNVLTELLTRWEHQTQQKGVQQAQKLTVAIQQIMSVLDKAKQYACLTPLQQTALTELAARFDRSYQRFNPPKDLLHDLIVQVAQATPHSEGSLRDLGQGKLTPLYQHADNLKVVNPTQFQALQQRAQMARRQVLRLLRLDLQHVQEGDGALAVTLFVNISRLVTFIQHLGSANDEAQVRGALRQVFQCYLRNGASGRPLTPHHWWQDVESLLINVAPVIYDADLKQSVQTLRDQRIHTNGCDFQSACQRYYAVAPAVVSPVLKSIPDGAPPQQQRSHDDASLQLN